MSLVEVTIALAIAGGLGLLLMNMQSNQSKVLHHFEFHSKKEQLRLAILGQVLKNPVNCGCLFKGAAEFADTGIPELTGYIAPTGIGKYEPADCTGGVPSPLVSSDGVDGVKLLSVSLTNVQKLGGTYDGKLNIKLESMKQVLGPKESLLTIPVSLEVGPGVAAGTVVVTGCSVSGAGIASDLVPLLRRVVLKENTVCLRTNYNTLHNIAVTCDAGTALLSCSGGPGDMFEEYEAFWIVPDYTTDTCTLKINRPACNSGQPESMQKVIAMCYPLN